MKFDRKKLLLYAVTDRFWLDGRRLYDVVNESLDGGVTFFQLIAAHVINGVDYTVSVG